MPEPPIIDGATITIGQESTWGTPLRGAPPVEGAICGSITMEVEPFSGSLMNAVPSTPTRVQLWMTNNDGHTAPPLLPTREQVGDNREALYELAMIGVPNLDEPWCCFLEPDPAAGVCADGELTMPLRPCLDPVGEVHRVSLPDGRETCLCEGHMEIYRREVERG